jgi:predicted nucleic acid-binding protein
MPATRAIDIVSDASVALKWFHTEGEEEVASARALLEAHKARTVVLTMLDHTAYELGHALLRGRARATAEQTATVIEALAEICPAISPGPTQMRLATQLAARHNLTLYDAAYAAVAQTRDAILVTLHQALLDASLGKRPSEVLSRD